MAWDPSEEARTAHDFASVGIGFLTDDGSSIDFAHVPGLSRTQIDPHSYYVPGPAYCGQGDHSQTSRVRFAFFTPAPAKHLIVTIRSWRNSHPFAISDLKICQTARPAAAAQEVDASSQAKHLTVPASRRAWWELSTTPRWQSYGIVRGRSLFVRGQLVNRGPESDGALARIVFRDAQGKELPAPYEGISSSPALGPFVDLPVHRQARRFTLELAPPSQAATVELGFQAWRDEALISLVVPLEVSIGDDLMLENVLGDDNPSGLGFLEEVGKRLGWSPSSDNAKMRVNPADQFIVAENLGPLVTFHDRLRTIQRGDAPIFADNHLLLSGHEAWPVPETPDWTEDPYRSPAWRLEFQSLSWLLDIAASLKLGGPARAADLAVSWVKSNPWGQPKDVLSTYPLAMAVRAEVLLHLLASHAASKGKKDVRRQQELFAEIVRYGFALSEIVSQNIFPPSIIQLRTACALLAISSANPLFPLAPHWKSVAIAQLRSGFDQLIGPDGISIEQSLHYRLEIISIGLLLSHDLKSAPETKDLRERLEARLKDGLKVIVGITDPAGMLPPIGDTPPGYHHASWLRRLISGYGRSLLSDPQLAEELSYPTGSRIFAHAESGAVSFRAYERKPNWSYVYTSFGEQRHENGHFDCSSFVYTARGIRWITDPGGASLHDVGSSRYYLTSSRAHNVALPDGRGQSSGLGWIESRATLGGASVVRIGTNVHGPTYEHARTIICLEDLDAIAVFDHFRSSEGSISFDGLLHFEENIAVALANSNLAMGFRGKNRLRLVPHAVTGQFGGMAIHNGRNDRPGALQGFVSHPLGGLQPANALTYKFFGSEEVCGGMILAISEQGLKRVMELLVKQELKRLLA